MRRALIAAGFALASVASADVMPLATSNLLLDLQSVYPQLRVRTMPAQEVRALCENVAWKAGIFNGMRNGMNRPKAQALEMVDAMVLDGTLTVPGARVNRAIINYTYGQPVGHESDALERETLLACRMNLEH